MDDLYPIRAGLVSREERELYLHQHAHVFWLTGLSGAGKSTLAKYAERRLHTSGYLVKVLDGDDVRSGLCADLDFSTAGRQENIRRVAHAARLLMDSGVIVICSFISPFQAMRTLARDIVGQDSFSEVYISTSIDECERRDVKGLYKRARNGEIVGFTGIDAPYESPTNPDLTISTFEDIAVSAQSLIEYILQKVKL